MNASLNFLQVVSQTLVIDLSAIALVGGLLSLINNVGNGSQLSIQALENGTLLIRDGVCVR
jgi:hypothetical protein